jgi:hypothetical protein
LHGETSLTSTAHGKPIISLSKETKGGLIIVINTRMPQEVKEQLMKESKRRYITYEQAIQWLIEREAAS